MPIATQEKICISSVTLRSISQTRCNKAFRHVETLFIQGTQVRTESKQTSLFGNKKDVCVDSART